MKTGQACSHQPQVVQALAKVSPRVVLIALRPERPGQPVSLDRALRAQREQGQQPEAFAGAKAFCFVGERELRLFAGASNRALPPLPNACSRAGLSIRTALPMQGKMKDQL